MTENSMDRPVKTLASPEEAVANFIGEHFLEWLLDYVTERVKIWPELAEIRASQPKLEKLRKYAVQRYIAAEAFLGGREGDPGFLGFAIANLSESPDPMAENALGILEQKRQEEMGKGSESKHQQLWVKFLKSLGITDEEISHAEPKEMTRRYISDLSEVYSTSEWQTAMGAFLAHERAIPEEYAAISEMIKKNTAVSADALAVFSWHIGMDVKYVINTQHMLEKIVVDPESKQLVLEGILSQLSTRQEFYRGLMKYLK
ncbi:MAG: iron-containing redox enzyme family protein [Acidobacteriaceae bacterium]